MDKIPPEIFVFLISASPIVELRGAIPSAIHIFHFPWWKAVAISIPGNMVPVLPLLLFLNFIKKLSLKINLVKKIYTRFENNLRKKGKIVEKYEFLGLVIFVAIPFAGTGAWTGSLIASILGLEYKKSFTAIFLGVLIAGIIVTTLSLLKWWGVLIGTLLIITTSFILNKTL